MNKSSLFFAIPLCLSFLAGCGTSSSLPKTKFEKVQYALNGVEKSLTEQKGVAKKAKPLSRFKRSEEDAIGAIYNLFSAGTSSEPDFQYDEPPMIQFLYIKKTLEKIGSGFDFGVKYQTTITGSIYYDFTTGKDTQEAAFKQDYSLNFSLYISIDDNDLINCQTLFDVNYTHGDDAHHQVMYAYLLLDYDMTKTDANYKLKLFAVDDCSDFQNDKEKYFSAEFDYVDVSSDRINEWGKIGYSTNKAIVFDANHRSFSDYASQSSLKLKPTIQLYRNGLRYQRNQLDNDKVRQAITIACDELGVNGTDIKYKDYISKPHTAQPILKTCFEDFSNIYGRDLMYNIVYTGAKSDGQGGGGEGDQDRIDSTWPTQSLIDDGYGDVPGFLSKTATFSVNRGYTTDSESYSYLITVLNFQPDDFDRYQRTLVESGFTITKGENYVIYLHTGGNGIADYAVSILREGGTDMIVIGKLVQQEPKEDILVQNANTYTGDYSSYKEATYQRGSEVASIVERLSNGRISASAISQYVIAGSSKSYEITLDPNEFTNDELNLSYSEYLKSYSNWSIIDANGAFYTTANGIDVLVMLDKDSARGIINIHSFAFIQGSISEILSGQGGGSGSGSQEPIMVTVSLYEVTEGVPTFVESRTFNEGESINLISVFGPGKYYEEPGCAIPLPDDIIARDGLSIYRKVESQEPTQGSIVIMDANTEQELFTYTDVIGATVKGGAIFSYVLYKDSSCGTMVGLDEELTLAAEPITLYCQDYSKVDYVTLTVNTYINGILSPNRTQDFGIRKGEILNNYSSYSFPVYYDGSSYFDSNYTMTLDGKALGSYTQDLIALTENGVLNIYCENDWCNVYHIKNGTGEVQFDALWEGSLSEGDVILHSSRYYTISSISGDVATYDSSEAAYAFSECSVYNGKVITTQKEYFPASLGWSIYIEPGSTPTYFLDPKLTQPLTPAEGQNEVVFKNPFTLYKQFTK